MRRPERLQRPPAIRAAVDYGPLLVFVAVNKLAGGFAPATAALMVTVTVGLATAWHFERRLPPIPLFTAVLVLAFAQRRSRSARTGKWSETLTAIERRSRKARSAEAST